MTSTKEPLHDVALAKSMSEEFVYRESEGGWTLFDLAELLMRALLGQGAKTLTHSARVFENYQQLLVWMRYTCCYLYDRM